MPHLTFPSPPERYRVLEQRTEGFKVKVWQSTGQKTPSTWKAEGRPRPNE